jgi:hypothetical protein
MKTMTRRQLGGPYDQPHHGGTADDVIHARDQHLRQAVADGDTTHESALTDMKAAGSDRSRN